MSGLFMSDIVLIGSIYRNNDEQTGNVLFRDIEAIWKKYHRCFVSGQQPDDIRRPAHDFMGAVWNNILQYGHICHHNPRQLLDGRDFFRDAVAQSSYVRLHFRLHGNKDF